MHQTLPTTALNSAARNSAAPTCAASMSRLIVAAFGATVAAMLAGAVALWFHYGTAVFYEMILSGIAACF